MTEFEDVYQKYFKDVFLFLKGLTREDSLAEELTQETFFKAMKSINDFQGRCDIRVWLCQIAKNAYFSYLRKNGTLSTYEALDHGIATGINIEQQIMDKDIALRIYKILHELKEPYKEVFNLRVFGELSFKQIADVFGKNENWACVTYHRAKNRIQTRLED